MSKISPAVWEAIRVRWLAGESPYRIAQTVPVSKSAIQKRQRREGWSRDPARTVDRASFRELGENTEGNRQRIVELLASGASYIIASMVVGATVDQVRAWRRADPEFQRQCDAARGLSLLESEQTVATSARTDYKAAKIRLAAAPETRDQYGAIGGSGSKLEIVVHIDRGEAPLSVQQPRGVTIEHERQEPRIEPAANPPAAIEEKQTGTDAGLIAEPAERKPRPAFSSEPLTQGEAIALAEQRRQREADERRELEKRLRAEYVESESSRWDGSLS